jgi:hypothetical protein
MAAISCLAYSSRGERKIVSGSPDSGRRRPDRDAVQDVRDVGPGVERLRGVEVAEAVQGFLGRKGERGGGPGGVRDEVFGRLWALLGIVALEQDAGGGRVEEFGVEGPVLDPAGADPAGLLQRFEDGRGVDR